VLRADGQWGVVTGWKVVAGTQVMYNLEVARDHTFTVGVGEWVVHNSCVVQDARSSNTFNDAMRQEVQPTLDRIEQGISDPHPTDGTPFANRDGDLPAQSPNYYTEFVHHPSGVINIPGDISRGSAGAQRIIIGNEGEVYYAPYHYRFVIYRLY
jgi:guanyl-specific ribonuclease Sa